MEEEEEAARGRAERHTAVPRHMMVEVETSGYYYTGQDLGYHDLTKYNTLQMVKLNRYTQKITKEFAQRKKPKSVCTICLDKPLTHAVMPCGHKCMCGDCAAKLTSKVCPICKDEYITIGKIYEC